MPNIREFTSPVDTFRPSEIGVDAAAQAARRIGTFSNQTAGAIESVGQSFGRAVRNAGDTAVAYEEHREISHGAAAFAQLNDNLTQAWNDTAKNADPNDPSVAAKFRETVLEPALEKYRDAFNTEGGQKFAEARVDQLRNHMFEKTAADMSTLAANAVKVNVEQTANSLSNTAMRDPSSVAHLLDSADGLVGDIVSSSPNIKGAASASARTELTFKMKEAIAKAGAIGAIQSSADPEKTAAEWGAKYPEYISGADLKTLAANARAQIRARNYDFEIQRRRDKEIATDRSTEATNQYLIDVRSKDPKFANDPTAVKILNDPALLKSDKNMLLNYIDRKLKPETDSRLSKATFVGLLRDLRDPNADPDKVMDKAWDARLKDPGTQGSMTESDFNAFRNEVIGRKTPDGAALEHDRSEFFKRYAPAIDPSIGSTGLHSALGSQRMYDAEMSARQAEADARKAGKDPREVYNPSSPLFFGKPENVAKYRASLQDAQSYQSQIEKPASKTQPFKPPAGWQFSPSLQQYRDPSGKIYDINGKEVK